ncbi:hypothetical protein THASP1DRAFT_30194 [Thamnocephalis sphaerospora]|uniref:Transcription factor TFIIB cyclin-like domain-containing protein n=1 Tax=Thamnocephalis sphaerospora TaxID=78915 RepID=A0A4P9XPQ5_9FUNG|nr:hypothetical protein THASP1DRAFT_30194 [Thamnocephalis sphaerospora]|eukprot:RKP07993.1 hypothetical protein THASP1DRAFT_30194 [Thamnocephalis sphaerospora]
MHAANRRASGSAISPDGRGYSYPPPPPPLSTWGSPSASAAVPNGMPGASVPGQQQQQQHEQPSRHLHHAHAHHPQPHHANSVSSDPSQDARRHHTPTHAYTHRASTGYQAAEVMAGTESGAHQHHYHHAPAPAAHQHRHQHQHQHASYGAPPQRTAHASTSHHPHHAPSQHSRVTSAQHPQSRDVASHRYATAAANEAGSSGAYAHAHTSGALPPRTAPMHAHQSAYAHPSQHQHHHHQHATHMSQQPGAAAADRKYSASHLPMESGDMMARHAPSAIDRTMMSPKQAASSLARRESMTATSAHPYDTHGHGHSAYTTMHSTEAAHAGWGRSAHAAHTDAYSSHPSRPYTVDHPPVLHRSQHHHHPSQHHHSRAQQPRHATQYASASSTSQSAYAPSVGSSRPQHGHPVHTSHVHKSHQQHGHRHMTTLAHDAPRENAAYGSTADLPSSRPSAVPQTNGAVADGGYAPMAAHTAPARHPRPLEPNTYGYPTAETHAGLPSAPTHAHHAQPPAHRPAQEHRRPSTRDWRETEAERAAAQGNLSRAASVSIAGDSGRDYAAHQHPPKPPQYSQPHEAQQSRHPPKPAHTQPQQRSYYSHQLLQPQPPLAPQQTLRTSRPVGDGHPRTVIDLTSDEIEGRISPRMPHRYAGQHYQHHEGRHVHPAAGHIHAHGHAQLAASHNANAGLGARRALVEPGLCNDKPLTDGDAAGILCDLKALRPSNAAIPRPDSPSSLLQLAQQKAAELAMSDPTVHLDPVVSAWASGRQATILAQFDPVVSPFEPQALISDPEEEEEEEDEKAKVEREQQQKAAEGDDGPLADADQRKTRSFTPPSPSDGSASVAMDASGDGNAVANDVAGLVPASSLAPMDVTRTSQKRPHSDGISEEKETKRIANMREERVAEVKQCEQQPAPPSPMSVHSIAPPTKQEPAYVEPALLKVQEGAKSPSNAIDAAAPASGDVDAAVATADSSIVASPATTAITSSPDPGLAPGSEHFYESAVSSPASTSSHQQALEADKHESRTLSDGGNDATSSPAPATPRRSHLARAAAGRVTPNSTPGSAARTPTLKRTTTPSVDDPLSAQDTVNWESLDLPEGERAYEIFKDVLVSKDLQRIRPTSKRREALLMAITLILCRQSNIPRTFAELSKAAQVAKRDIGACYKWLCTTLNPDLVVIRHIEPDEFMKRWCNALQLNDYVLPVSVYCYRQTDRLGVFSGKCPTSVAAASIWFVIWSVNNAATILQEVRKGSDFTNLRCSSSSVVFAKPHPLDQTPRITCDQKTVASVAGVVIATLMSTYKGMVPHVNELMPPGFLEALLTEDGVRVMPDGLGGISKLYTHGKLVDMPSAVTDYRPSNTLGVTPSDAADVKGDDLSSSS